MDELTIYMSRLRPKERPDFGSRHARSPRPNNTVSTPPRQLPNRAPKVNTVMVSINACGGGMGFFSSAMDVHAKTTCTLCSIFPWVRQESVKSLEGRQVFTGGAEKRRRKDSVKLVAFKA